MPAYQFFGSSIGVAVAVVAACVQTSGAAAQDRIDTHHHFLPPDYAEYCRKEGGVRRRGGEGGPALIMY